MSSFSNISLLPKSYGVGQVPEAVITLIYVLHDDIPLTELQTLGTETSSVFRTRQKLHVLCIIEEYRQLLASPTVINWKIFAQKYAKLPIRNKNIKTNF